MDLSHAVWRKSRRSTDTGQNCVEVAALPGHRTAVRDSKNPDDGALVVPPAEWRDFAQRVRSGQYDL